MIKVYAIRKGRKKGIVSTWEECEQNVKGYSGAEFKSFSADTYNDAINEAMVYMQGISDVCIEDTKNILRIYVDGSFNDDVYGAGIVILEDKVKTISLRGDNPDMLSMRNVAGEILAATVAMNYAVKNKIKSICIYYDYEGIAKWCQGSWQPKNENTKKYKEYYDKVSKSVNIVFSHIKAHTGNKYNEIADQLAKNAVGIIEYKPNFDISTNSFIEQEKKEYPKEKGIIEPIYSGIIDENGESLQLGDLITCFVDNKQYLGYLDYDNHSNCYFMHFETYWSGHPFRKGIKYFKVRC